MRKILLPAILMILAVGFWNSANFKEIADLKRNRLQREVDIIHARRSKGLQVYKAARNKQLE